MSSTVLKPGNVSGRHCTVTVLIESHRCRRAWSMLSLSHPLNLLDWAHMLHYPYRHGVGGQRWFYYPPKGGYKNSAVFCIILTSLSLSHYLSILCLPPGDEPQEENKEEEIYQLWNGEDCLEECPSPITPPNSTFSFCIVIHQEVLTRFSSVFLPLRELYHSQSEVKRMEKHFHLSARLKSSVWL